MSEDKTYVPFFARSFSVTSFPIVYLSVFCSVFVVSFILLFFFLYSSVLSFIFLLLLFVCLSVCSHLGNYLSSFFCNFVLSLCSWLSPSLIFLFVILLIILSSSLSLSFDLVTQLPLWFRKTIQSLDCDKTCQIFSSTLPKDFHHHLNQGTILSRYFGHLYNNIRKTSNLIG